MQKTFSVTSKIHISTILTVSILSTYFFGYPRQGLVFHTGSQNLNYTIFETDIINSVIVAIDSN